MKRNTLAAYRMMMELDVQELAALLGVSADLLEDMEKGDWPIPERFDHDVAVLVMERLGDDDEEDDEGAYTRAT